MSGAYLQIPKTCAGGSNRECGDGKDERKGSVGGKGAL